MEQYTEAFVGIDTAKNKHALTIADPGRDGEIRYLGEIDSAPAAVGRLAILDRIVAEVIVAAVTAEEAVGFQNGHAAIPIAIGLTAHRNAAKQLME